MKMMKKKKKKANLKNKQIQQKNIKKLNRKNQNLKLKIQRYFCILYKKNKDY